jgi:hypothetical protein
MIGAEEQLAETIAQLEKENARDEERLAARRELLVELRRTFSRYRSAIDGGPPSSHQVADKPTDATTTPNPNVVVANSGARSGGRATTSTIHLGKTSRAETIRQILGKHRGPLSTQDIMRRLYDLGDGTDFDKKGFWRVIDSVLRRGAKPEINEFRKVGTALWEASDELRQFANHPEFKFDDA